MGNDLAPHRYPWEPAPAKTPSDEIALIQRDLQYMVRCTGVLVHSSRDALAMMVNTPRGQIIPVNECVFTDGTTFKLQDIGMPQPGAPEMTIPELLAQLWDVAQSLGLELPK